jgi:pyruvate kinase
MAKISAGADEEIDRCAERSREHPQNTGAEDVIGMAAELLVSELNAVAIVAATMSGETARFVSMARPSCPIIGLSPEAGSRRRMALYRGVYPFAIKELKDPEGLAGAAARTAVDMGLARDGDLLVLVYGEPMGSGVRANTVRLARVES